MSSEYGCRNPQPVERHHPYARFSSRASQDESNNQPMGPTDTDLGGGSSPSSPSRPRDPNSDGEDRPNKVSRIELAELMLIDSGQSLVHDDPTICEVYSPPRITTTADDMGLGPGWALDIGTCSVDGMPWDFDDPLCRERAKALVCKH